MGAEKKLRVSIKNVSKRRLLEEFHRRLEWIRAEIEIQVKCEPLLLRGVRDKDGVSRVIRLEAPVKCTLDFDPASEEYQLVGWTFVQDALVSKKLVMPICHEVTILEEIKYAAYFIDKVLAVRRRLMREVQKMDWPDICVEGTGGDD